MGLAGASVGGGIGGGIGGLIGGLAVLGGAAGEGGEKDYKKALRVWQDLELSDFDFTSLSAPELQLLGQYFPEAYEAIVPEEFQQVGRAPTYRDEITSLSQLKELAETGEADIDRIQRLEIEDYVAGAQGRGREDALRDVARRGQFGGGDALRARISGNQQASQLASQMGRGAIADRAGRRMQAVGEYGQQAGAVSGRELGRQMANQQSQNRYSELWAGLQTDAARYAADQRAYGQTANLQRSRTVGDANALNRYRTQLENLQRQNALRSSAFGERLAKTGGTAGAHVGLGGLRDRERDMRAQAIVGAGQGLGQAAGGLVGGGLF